MSRLLKTMVKIIWTTTFSFVFCYHCYDYSNSVISVFWVKNFDYDMLEEQRAQAFNVHPFGGVSVTMSTRL